jgi:ribosome-binding factor A
MGSPRVQRVAAALQQEVSKIIHDDLKDPRVGFVTVTKVEITPDLRSAKIYISVMGSEKNKRDSLIGLKQAAGYIRKLIGERINLRYTPEIRFSIDKTSEYVQHIDEIIDKIHKENDEKTEENA